MLRIASPLSADTEHILESVIGCALNIHCALGPGFFEPVYHNAMIIELLAAGVMFESEKRVAGLIAINSSEDSASTLSSVVRSLSKSKR